MDTLDLYIRQLRVVAACQIKAADRYAESDQAYEAHRAQRVATWCLDRAERFARAQG